ncbi:hypothetical protein B0J18DRAFT_413607 [Chaetomium sp. MPI-SDFR-AT-0129]|nr:hypothetical protein B0J18DRAFT_413607 [Chaetomium sp. MPI-SDFR-AT-0129]
MRIRQALVGLLALASTAAVVCAWFWPAPFFSVSANHVPAGWTGDPRVNLSISSLHPEDIDILAIPFPVADLATVADMYTHAPLDILPHHHAPNITLRLDAPGLAPVDVASWLFSLCSPPFGFDGSSDYWEISKRWEGGGGFALWLKVYVRQSTTGPGEYKQVQALRAEHAPLAVDRANVTLTLELMETLWPVLIQAANDLLVLGLGRDHPDYRPLRNSLIEPGRTKPALLSLVRAKELWEGLHSSALAWPYGAQAFLRSVRAFMQPAVERRADNNNNNNSTIAATFPRIGSSQPPTSLRLLRHARRQHPPNQTLPGLLASLQPSANTTGQLRGMMVALDSNLDINRLGLCRVPRLLEAIAEGHCIRTNTSGMSIPYWAPLGSHCHPTDCMGGLREALCDAEELLSSVAAAAERAKARVLEERGGGGALSRWERVVGRYYRDGVAWRTRTLERALDAFHALYPALRLQRRVLLADLAASVQRTCDAQDALRARVHAARKDQSSWWDLKWDAGRETVALTFVTLPELQDTVAPLDAAYDRIEAQFRELWQLEKQIEEAVGRLKTKVSDGWLERLGLGDLPLEEEADGVGKPSEPLWSL